MSRLKVPNSSNRFRKICQIYSGYDFFPRINPHQSGTPTALARKTLETFFQQIHKNKDDDLVHKSG